MQLLTHLELCFPKLAQIWFTNVPLDTLNSSALLVIEAPLIRTPAIYPLWKLDRLNILTYLNMNICKMTKEKKKRNRRLYHGHAK